MIFQRENSFNDISQPMLNQYDLSITSQVSFFKDNFDEGCELIRQYSTPIECKETNLHLLSIELEDFIFDHLKKHLNFFDKHLLKEVLNKTERRDTTFCIFQQFDKNNTTPSPNQIELWEEGEEELFLQQITVKIWINGNDITNDLLYYLIF